MNRREREAKAAATLRECRAALAARGSSVVREAIGGAAAEPEEWRHYPDGEVYDPLSHAQYFYHRHVAPRGAVGPAEHGHFHLFLRGEGMPPGVAPMLLPELAVANAPSARQSAPLKRGGSDRVCHLAAIAVDVRGEPIRLFTTNRWVTGETWYRAEDVIRLIDLWRLRRPLLLNRWLEALVRLFHEDLAALLRQRDKALIEWRWRWPRRNVFEDPRFEIVSSVAIDLEARLAAVEAREATSPAPPVAGPTIGLPGMAEGWGA